MSAPRDGDEADRQRAEGRLRAIEGILYCQFGRRSSRAGDRAMAQIAQIAKLTESAAGLAPPTRAHRRMPWRVRLSIGAAAAVAACLVFAWIAWFAREDKAPDKPGPGRTTVTLSADWQVQPTGDAQYEVISPTQIRLDRGELLVQSVSGGEPSRGLTVETPAGMVRATGTRFFVGTHRLEPFERTKGTAVNHSQRSYTRVLVLAGVVALTNASVTVTGRADDLLAAQTGAKPTKLAIRANSDFAMDLYKQLAKENEGKNLFFSPYSISSALAMTAEGARGNTAAEMGKVLRFPAVARRIGPDAQRIPWQTAMIHTGMGRLNRSFNAEKKAYELNVANALWGEKTFPFREGFVRALNEPYGAVLFPANFVSDWENERLRINKWVEDRTNKRIKDLLPAGSLDDLTRLVLTNAIYFKGDWQTQFDSKLTAKTDFTLADGTTQKASMMSPKGKIELPYAALKADGTRGGRGDKDGFAVVEMPYKGKDLSMVALLPNRHDGLAELEGRLTNDNLAAWIGSLTKTKDLVLRFPRFRAEREYVLSDGMLQKLGMNDAFDRLKADFTGLSDSSEARRLYISLVIHKSFIQVNEQGSEAAAATAVVVHDASLGPMFIANRPFIYLIRHRTTGSILFLGRMMVPE